MLNFDLGSDLDRYVKLKAAVLVLAGLLSCSFHNRQQVGFFDFTTWASQKSDPPIVGIVPFTNQTNEPDLPNLVRVAFYGHFSPLPFKDLEITEIDGTLNLFEKHQQKSFKTLSTVELGSILGCQALVFGEVTEFSKLYAGVYSQIGIGAKIRIADTEDGRTIWEDSFTTRFHEGNIPLTQINAIFSLAKSGLNLRTTQELRAIDDLCRNLVARIPKVSFFQIEKAKRVQLCELQIAAFKSIKRAQAVLKRLREKKYRAFIRTVDEGGVIWHRVLMGPFDCGEETDRWREKIVEEFDFEPMPVKIHNPDHPVSLKTRKEN